MVEEGGLTETINLMVLFIEHMGPIPTTLIKRFLDLNHTSAVDLIQEDPMAEKKMDISTLTNSPLFVCEKSLHI